MKMSTWKNGAAFGIGSIADALKPSTCSKPDETDETDETDATDETDETDGLLLLLLLLLSVMRPVQLQQTVGGSDNALAVVTMPGTWSGT